MRQNWTQIRYHPYCRLVTSIQTAVCHPLTESVDGCGAIDRDCDCDCDKSDAKVIDCVDSPRPGNVFRLHHATPL